MALLATFVLMKDRIDVERYLSITNVSEDYNVTSDGGRLELWESAINLTLEHPLTGVGTECFPFAHFQSRERAGESFLRWQYTHNSFLQVASEVGLIGFAIFLAMILRSLLAFARAAAMGGKWSSGEQLQASVLGGLMLLGFSGLLVTGFFLSQGYSIFFTLYFALAAIMRRVQADLSAGPAASANPGLLPDRPVS
jgi:O-antigen ligase